jgi:hypothetical protein
LTRFLSSQGSKLRIACLVAFLFSQTAFADSRIVFHGKVVDNIQQHIGNVGVSVYYNSANNSAKTDTSGVFNISFTFTSVKQDPGAFPTKWDIGNNYPNPFNPSTNIEFSLPLASHVTLKVYDLRGREVGTFVNQDFGIGKYKATFKLTGLSNGVYIARMEAIDEKREVHTSAQKLLLLYGSQHNINPLNEIVKIGESNTNYTSIQSRQHLSKATTTFRIDSVVVSGAGITRTKFTDIPVNSDSVNLGDLVVNSAPRQSASIPNQTVREAIDTMNLDLNQFVANDNATGYSSQNPKIQIVGSHAIFRPDSSDVSSNYTV